MKGKKLILPEGMTYNKWYYLNRYINKPRPSRKKNPNQRCLACDIKMLSKYGSKTRKIYCNSCAESLSIRIRRLHFRRSYQKRVGKDPEPITLKNILRETKFNIGIKV